MKSLNERHISGYNIHSKIQKVECNFGSKDEITIENQQIAACPHVYSNARWVKIKEHKWEKYVSTNNPTPK